MLDFLLALLATVTVGALLVPLLRPRLASTNRLDGELAIYRDQLAEIERERAAGRLAETDAAAARLEIERRTLAAADSATPATGTGAPFLRRILPTGLALAIPLLALGVYLQIGSPGLPSAPVRAAPPSPAGQPTDIPRLVAEARARANAQPNDFEAQAALGEALALEADGTVTPAAAEAFRKALALEAGDARSIYYLGLQEAQAGDSVAALKRWRDLEARSPAEAPYLPVLRSEIARVAKAAGLPNEGPADAMPQPSRDQQEAMASMSPDRRQQAIRSGWLRLATAWKVLGENDKAADAFAHADTLAPVDARILVDWAEAHVRSLKPGEAPTPAAVAVLQRLEKAEPRNGVALFYLGAASYAAGDKKAAAERWKTLLALLPADAPIRDMLQQRIKDADGG